MGVLVITGLCVAEAVRLVERFGAQVFAARASGGAACVLDVSMDTASANAIALAMLNASVQFFQMEQYSRLAS